MKKFKIKIAALALAFGVVSVTGCKKFLDINENPNAPSDANVTLLLPSAQASIAHVLGNQFQVYGGIWGQYWTQSPSASQYKTIDQYSINASSFDRSWRILYTNALQDLQVVITKAAAAPQYQQYAAISYILKGYTYQMLTDAFGDVPVKEANNVNITNPHYDPQEVVYDSVFYFINKGLSMIDLNTEAVPGSEDLLFAGDMGKWQQFGNTLKLRAALRLSQVAPQAAEDTIKALQAAGVTFLTEDAAIQYSTTGGNQNPLFAEILGLGRTQNLVASSTAVDQMNQNHDPRVNVFYEKVEALDTVVGITQGAFDTITTTIPYSIPTPAVGAKGLDDQSALAPVKLISASESYFLQSEAAARGWWTGADAAQLFRSGISASFADYGLAGEASAYITNAPAAQWPAGLPAQIKAIITQKYFAMCGNQSFEAWTEWRRTNYPDFLVVSLASALGNDQRPLRLLYPNTEVTQNSNFPGLKTITTPVWWDKLH
ncbi:MAG TPA: SusD/RagB family nutrient-binding outer membrane lipoprotein [Chitinophaga sp.]|uniref:SusD/RagB family nutrient-binding outer membrane lipoprotein n=1 Tax=Chitinophaga sp. TaxID=1869181 RepID=UPI002DB776E6|nr:SusD/RagB family nutrient-binding outer membrane lipoprotein [Chitinophaga sp.]HEU4551424.1 SusD/RagB family nutrient-binding outer membrane lipoprotein [Chitinophaga sp.]